MIKIGSLIGFSQHAFYTFHMLIILKMLWFSLLLDL